ncbi:cation:proton antiporter [Candidatus Desantisbacteria bacterium CG_4_10_14_0_8_um_filter_48_22]|uniref:Cation:proton antiporter n=1 Tax=Candidatus Desantisbacteria bacterium CG_4_10_14_0_8_um_filter_48_22 TaxID=1974543 RepID=A0A2M7S901_9BACT|nr:MAG: cation:proton antiporter [Candidatus Desantisbacteria bacterium CG1_02_49_89]PIV57001.1 MAG: cation:proton antiporter [Candidatus Desantisbacteria bacterium CG02_land_8_20_14_3_00_49_13]PIZ15997.1 MAG: cation:proton antiporter [Candidatus Desantisbacteria bacterium CG_4_10_14_0_8_um_filter_48_22]
MLIYVLCMILFAIGIYGIVVKKNLVKIIISFCILDYAVNLFFILIGYKKDGIAPIMMPGQDKAQFVAQTVDPLPQALVLTSIVIGLGITILMVAIAIRLYDKYGTFDVMKMRKLKG